MGLVVIAGAGVGGPALACLLRGLGRRVVLLEARAAVDDGEGAFLGVAPNGMRALERIGIARELAAIGHPCSAFRFRNAAGRIVGAIDRRRDRERFGHALTMVRRGDLHRLLARRAEEAGAELRLSCAALDARFDPSGRPQVRAADGDLVADVLVGADGLGSMIRRSLFPEAPPPRDSGWIDAGGFAPGTFGLEPGVNEMVFGARGFFGAFATSAGETWWFSNGAAPSSPLAGEPLREHLLATHTNDGAWVGEVIRATPRVLGAWPLRDLPRVPRWSSGRAALLGDAAHAMSPSAGQGASMALEDAVALARSLRDVPDVPAALAAYERARRPRVARVFAHAERASAGKVVPGPIAACLRDLFLPIGLRFGARAQDEGYAWEESW